MTTIALVGCAHIHTPGFSKRLQDRSDVTVKSVWDPEPTLAKKYAEQLDASTVDDVAEIWSDDEIDAVVITSETDIHEELVNAAAAAKKHMFVEKPLGLRADDAYAMANAIKEAGVLFQTGYFQRGDPINLFAKQQLEAGTLGHVTRIRHSNCHSGSLGDWFTPDFLWMTDPARAGVGAFGDLGTHSLDILMWLMGDISAVTAQIDPVTARYPDCDESGEALIRFQNGVIGTLAAGWVDVADPVRMLISGTEGHIHVHNREVYFKSNKVDGADGESPWTDLPEGWPHAFELFFDAVAGKEGVSLVDPHEAAARSDVMAAMYEGAQNNTWVKPQRT